MPADRLPVHLNRQELHGVEVPDTFETSGAFDVTLVNHGASVHVHLHLDDALSEVATIDAANHFIDGESERAVRVYVDSDEPTRGKLKIASAYGARTRYVDVVLTEPEAEEQSVEIDESLSKPNSQTTQRESESSLLAPISENPELLVLSLGVAAVLIAAVTAFVIDSVLVLLGLLAVVVGVLVAMYFLLTGS